MSGRELVTAGVSLAMAVQARKGVYALLLGSGLSRPAEILTGYELMCDLVSRIVRLEGAAQPEHPEEWFRDKYSAEATYSRVLEVAGRTRADRSNLLRDYFEPTDDERAEGKKQPTKAHRAIARMARAGHFRVIVTTNFDRLLEQALADEGVNPQVIATPEAARGRTPLVHSDVTVIKVHGDYLDLATSNTTVELAAYDSELDALLDEVFTNYGLVVCGWSGEWDEALRRAIVRSTRHRFGTYWMARGDLRQRAQQLVSMRIAVVVGIESADEAFEDLEQKVLALEEHRQANPVSPALAMAVAKRHLAEPSHYIRLDDLVRGETHQLAAVLEREFRVDTPAPDNQLFRARIERGETASATLMAIMAAGGRWGTAEHETLWSDTLEALARFKLRSGTSYPVWRSLRNYPLCLVLYAGGIAALSAGRYPNLSILLESMVKEEQKSSLICQRGAASSVLEKDLANQALGVHRATPMSERVAEHLRPLLSSFTGSAERYEELFDTFEFLLAMACADHDRDKTTGWPWIPMGRFTWNRETGVPDVPAKEDGIDEQWLPVAHGMFGGDIDRAKNAHRAVRKAWHNGTW